MNPSPATWRWLLTRHGLNREVLVIGSRGITGFIREYTMTRAEILERWGTDEIPYTFNNLGRRK